MEDGQLCKGETMDLKTSIKVSRMFIHFRLCKNPNLYYARR